MPEPSLAGDLRRRLSDAGQPSLADAVRRQVEAPGGERTSVDLIINANELTHAHGTGVLMSRVLEEAPPYVLFRAFDSWGGYRGVEPVAEYAFGRYAQDRADIAQFLTSRLPPWRVRRILAIPYTREDVIMAIAAKAVTGAPMAIWVMDDNSLCNPGVDRALFAELARAADARFVITGPMRELYEREYDLPFHVLPPLVARRLIREAPSAPPTPTVSGPRRGVMVGNVWHQNWLEEMLRALTGAGVETDWFTSSDDLYFLNLDEEKLRAAGVTLRHGLRHEEVARRTEAAEFVLIASSTMTETDGNAAAIGRLSLPSKMTFVAASAGTPMLVLANGQSGAADFVTRFGLGQVVPYDREALTVAAEALARSTRQLEIRRRAQALGSVFAANGAYHLLAHAAETGRLADDRFERLFPRSGSRPEPKGEKPPLTLQLHGRTLALRLQDADGRDSIATYCRQHGVAEYERPAPRLWAGLAAEARGAILDVGANTGLYALLAAAANPEADVVAFEPSPEIADRLEANLRLNPDAARRVRLERLALSDSSGTAELWEHQNDGGLLATTSTLADWAPEAHARYLPRAVRSARLDDHLGEGAVGLIKVDIEAHELAFLAGARRVFVTQRPFLLMEVLSLLDVEALAEWAEDLDYVDFALGPHGIERQLRARLVEGAANHLFCPRERLEAFTEIAGGLDIPVG